MSLIRPNLQTRTVRTTEMDAVTIPDHAANDTQGATSASPSLAASGDHTPPAQAIAPDLTGLSEELGKARDALTYIDATPGSPWGWRSTLENRISITLRLSYGTRAPNGLNGARWIAEMHFITAEEAKTYGVADNNRPGFARFSVEKSNYTAAIPDHWLLRDRSSSLLTLVSRPGKRS